MLLRNGSRGVLLKDLRLENRVAVIGPGSVSALHVSGGDTVPAGTEFSVIDNTAPHLDWFRALIDIDGFGRQLVGWGIVDVEKGFAEAVPE